MKNRKSCLPAGRGTTLVELVVVIFIIAILSLIIVSNFPQLLRQYALSRATYRLAQDLRRTEDLALSGFTMNSYVKAKGYGLYVNTAVSTTKYLIFAKITSGNFYTGNFSTALCSAATRLLTNDCPVEIIDLSKVNQSLSISGVSGGASNYNNVSIDFFPPGPNTTITYFSSGENILNTAQINLTNTDGLTKGIYVNTSGLINVQ